MEILIGPFIFVSVLFGGVLLVFTLVRMHKSKRCTKVVDAVISAMDHEPTDAVAGTMAHYTPVYKFTYNGQEYSIKGTYAINHHKFKIGDKVQIKINPDKPTEYLGDEDHFKKLYIAIPVIIITIFLFMFMFQAFGI